MRISEEAIPISRETAPYQKLSPQDVRTVSDERKERSPSVISATDNVDGLENLSNNNAGSNANLSTLTTPDSALGAVQLEEELVPVVLILLQSLSAGLAESAKGLPTSN